MKESYLLRKILMVGLLFVIFSCDIEEFTNNAAADSSKESGFSKKSEGIVFAYGPEVAVGNGFVYSWISFNKFNIPLEIGVAMSPELFDNLPSDGNFEKRLIVPLNDAAREATPFDHIEINWNPESYSSIRGFKEAHFDFHFFMITPDERLLIPAWSEATDNQFSLYPAKQFMPFNYSPLLKEEGSFQYIGRYWLSNNFDKDKMLTHTLALGTFDGLHIFITPVSSLEFIKSTLRLNENYSQPLELPVNKLFPREYNIFVDEKGYYNVTLSNFIRR